MGKTSLLGSLLSAPKTILGRRKIESDGVSKEILSSQGPPGGDDAYTRRRQQVRRAQINHRQRKEIYTKALEQELDTLREQARLTKQLLDCEAENQLLRELAVSNGLTLPPGRRTGEPHATVVQVSISGEPGPQQHMCAKSCQGPQLQTAISGHFGAHTLSSSGSSPLRDDSVLYLGNNASSAPLDIVSAGFDFVFMLEQPCLGHTHRPFGDADPSGHALTLQAASLAHTTDDSQPWIVPAIEFERLLQLSSKLGLEYEVTPIQAWDRIRNHPRFQDLTQERLMELAALVLPHIKCHGFGAVMDTDAFFAGFQEFLSRLPPRWL